MLARFLSNGKVKHVITAALTAAFMAGLQAAGVPLPHWVAIAVTAVVGS